MSSQGSAAFSSNEPDTLEEPVTEHEASGKNQPAASSGLRRTEQRLSHSGLVGVNRGEQTTGQSNCPSL